MQKLSEYFSFNYCFPKIDGRELTPFGLHCAADVCKFISHHFLQREGLKELPSVNLRKLIFGQ